MYCALQLGFEATSLLLICGVSLQKSDPRMGEVGFNPGFETLG